MSERWSMTVRKVEPGEAFTASAMYGHMTLLPTPWVAVLCDQQGSSYGFTPDKWTYHFGRTAAKAEKRARKYIKNKEEAEGSAREVAI